MDSVHSPTENKLNKDWHVKAMTRSRNSEYVLLKFVTRSWIKNTTKFYNLLQLDYENTNIS